MPTRIQFPRIRFDALPVMIFAGVLVASVAVATISVDRIENRTVESLEPILIASGESWASIVPDGVLIRITGEAPDEAASQRLADLIGNVVSPERIVNDSTFTPRDAQSELEASTFIVSALRDGDRVSLGGLVGTDDHRQIIHDAVRASVTDATINDLMIDVGEPAFVYSSEALQFGLASLALLPGSSVTIEADRVTITAAPPVRRRTRQSEGTAQRSHSRWGAGDAEPASAGDVSARFRVPRHPERREHDRGALHRCLNRRCPPNPLRHRTHRGNGCVGMPDCAGLASS